MIKDRQWTRPGHSWLPGTDTLWSAVRASHRLSDRIRATIRVPGTPRGGAEGRAAENE